MAARHKTKKPQAPLPCGSETKTFARILMRFVGQIDCNEAQDQRDRGYQALRMRALITKLKLNL